MATLYEDEDEGKAYEEYMQKKYEEDEKAYQKAANKAYSTWLKEWNTIKWQDLQGVVHQDYEISEIWEEDFNTGILFGGVSITRYADDGEELDTLYLSEKWSGKELVFDVGDSKGKIVGRVLVDAQ